LLLAGASADSGSKAPGEPGRGVQVRPQIWARPGFISHTQYEFSSVLKFIEDRFGLDPLTERDTAANDLTDSFDLDQDPLPPLILQTRACP
jgi:hypothetical protein